MWRNESDSIILYTTGCPKCKVLASKLTQKCISFSIVDDVEIMKNKGWLDVPKLELDNGDILNFIEANKYINEL